MNLILRLGLLKTSLHTSVCSDLVGGAGGPCCLVLRVLMLLAEVLVGGAGGLGE